MLALIPFERWFLIGTCRGFNEVQIGGSNEWVGGGL